MFLSKTRHVVCFAFARENRNKEEKGPNNLNAKDIW